MSSLIAREERSKEDSAILKAFLWDWLTLVDVVQRWHSLDIQYLLCGIHVSVSNSHLKVRSRGGSGRGRGYRVGTKLGSYLTAQLAGDEHCKDWIEHLCGVAGKRMCLNLRLP
jgi:hypothetical protein